MPGELNCHTEFRIANASKTPDLEGEEVAVVKRMFSRKHAIVIHLNAISMLAAVFYALWLSSTLELRS